MNVSPAYILCGRPWQCAASKEMPMERLAEETHIGIKNVVQRMYLEYGEAFRVKIISTAGFGTRIELEIPEDGGRREEKAYV